MAKKLMPILRLEHRRAATSESKQWQEERSSWSKAQGAMVCYT